MNILNEIVDRRHEITAARLETLPVLDAQRALSLMIALGRATDTLDSLQLCADSSTPTAWILDDLEDLVVDLVNVAAIAYGWAENLSTWTPAPADDDGPHPAADPE